LSSRASACKRALPQPQPPLFAYFDKGNMATIAVTYAIMERGRLKLSGPLGKLGWAFIHVLYLGRAEGQLMLCLQWIFGLLLGRTGSRYIDTPVAQPAASIDLKEDRHGKQRPVRRHHHR